ncbi:MAG: CapA family protein [Anaerolineaceae bacterium]
MRIKAVFVRGALILALLALPGCQKHETLEITFGGDIFLARDGEALFVANPWGAFSQADKPDTASGSERLFFANLESPLKRSDEKGPGAAVGYDLCAAEDQTPVLKAGGIDLVSIANNHRGDCGDAGGANTAAILKEASIRTVGPDLSPVVIDTSAGRVGVIAAEDVNQTVDADALVKQIKAVRPQCDILIVSMHWGNEYQAGAAGRQRELAQSIADAGADVLWGHHPHVLQPIEWMQSSDGSRKTLVMYSLGNLLSDQWMTPDTQRSALVTIRFSRGKIVSLSMQPVRMDRAERQLITPADDEIDWINRRLGLDQLTGIDIIPLP